MRIYLKPQFTDADINRQVQRSMEKLDVLMFTALRNVGLNFVKEAREKQRNNTYGGDTRDVVIATRLAGGDMDLGGFNDITGNLRSSIGFIIMRDGEILSEDFELSPWGTDKQLGLNEGKKIAKESGATETKGWALITVAGMEYASWVEAKGYDVITGSSIHAEAKLREAFKDMDKLVIE